MDQRLARKGDFAAASPVRKSLGGNPALAAKVGGAVVVVLKLADDAVFSLSAWCQCDASPNSIPIK